MKRMTALTLLSMSILAAPVAAGSLSDPIVTPQIIIADAEGSAGKGMAIVAMTAILLFAVAVN